MSDPRVDLLAKHIASVLVTLIDIARDGQVEATAPFNETVADVTAEITKEEPAKRRGRPPKAEALSAEALAKADVPAAEQPSADDPATPASEPTTATEAGTPATGAATTAAEDLSSEASAKEDTLVIAQELTIKLVQTKGRDTAVAALGDFNVGKASALAADQIGAYCEAVRELLSA